jgi:hypothetical protein
VIISAFIDPGSNASGLAIFIGKSLLLAKTFVVPDRTRSYHDKRAWMIAEITKAIERDEVEKVIVELPRVYPGSPADPEDLIQLACLAGSFRADKYVRPQDWKRQIPKTKKLEDYLVKKRAWAVLSKNELPGIEKPETHDLWDAIAMGLVCLGRLLPGLVKP